MQGRSFEEIPLTAPNSDGSVLPMQFCTEFQPRGNTPCGLRQCWYCRCADFHLSKNRSLDVGICCWPKKIIK